MKTSKRFCLILLAMAVLAAALPLGAVAADGSPAAVSADREGWIPVSTPEEFLAMESGNAYYLTQDIDFGGRTVPYLVEVFTGMLDGCGYALKNFTLTGEDASAERMGVFAKICEGSYTSVVNLVIGTPEAPVQMINTYSAGSTCYDGFLAGQLMTDGNVGVFDNITVYGEYTNRSDKKYFAGGLFGYAKKFVITDCTVYGSLTDEKESSAEKNLGGLVGLVNSQMNRQNVMTGCVNHADVSVVGSGSVRAGGLVAFSGSPLKMEDCTNTGAISGPQYAGGLVGNRYNSDLYVRDSESTGAVSGTNSGRILGGTQSEGTGRYLYIVGCGEDDTPVTEVSTLEELQGMTEAGGVWRLTGDLDLQGQSFENFVFSGADGFRGVFDGNGYAVYNFTINGSSSSDAGFFRFICKDADTLIVNLTLGTADAPVVLNTAATDGKTIGVLAAHGNNNTTYSALIDNVQIYADVTHTGGKANIGGFLGTSRRCAILGSSFAGSIRANLSALGSNWLNISAFSANVDADQTLFYNCVNYADISVSTTAGTDVRAAGFVAYSTKNNEFVDCANFGDIRTSGGSAPVAAGFQGHNAGTSQVLVYGCTNFGDIASDRYASGFLSWAQNPAVMMDAVNLGNVSGEAGADAFYNDAAADDTRTVTGFSCTDAENDLQFAMLTGASVRLNTPAGLRFAAQMNTQGLYYERMQRHTAFSYGMLISPTAFVTAAGGFTRAALDAYAEGTLGYTGEQRAYVSVPTGSGSWFGGTPGSVAGSLVNIREEHYGSSFSGVGYIDLTVDGRTVRTVYAADAQARCVRDVAAAALEDLLYRDAEGNLYRADGSAWTGADAQDYRYVVESGLTLEGVAGEVSSLSPYTADQRGILQDFAD